MHRSLLILEILLMIFSGANHSTLSRLARTCRLFHDPALNILWRYQETLVPLLKSMPPDLWEERGARGLHFRRPLISTDLDALNKYAWRIISLVFDCSDVDVGTLEALSRYIPSTSVLPKLRKFTGILPQDGPQIYPFMGLFLGAGVEVIGIYLHHSDIPLSFIPSIKTRCPSVRDLTLFYEADDLNLVKAVSDLICEYDELENLELISSNSRVLAHIATFSALRCLKLGSLSIKDIRSIAGSGLSRVSELALTTTEDVTTFDSFLSFIHPQHLQELTLTLWSEPPPSSLWKQFFQTLTQCCSAALTTLFIEGRPMPSDEGLRYAIEYPTLEKIFPFQHLTSLMLRCGGFYELDDDGLRHMALAWPNLESLGLRTCFDSPTRVEVSQITLRGLVPLLGYCPKLMELDIAIDASVVELHPLRLPERDIFNDKIVYITVGNSVINDPASVAGFFSRFLPSVKYIIAWDELEELDSDMGDDMDDELREARQYYFRWFEVPDLMRAARVAHQQEMSTEE